MEIFGNIWTIVECSAFLFVIFVFFKDPLRRWNFFGYRPTAVMVLFNPEQEKVLLIRTRSIWAFSQGGIYDKNINNTVHEILHRELGLQESKYRLINTEPLGTLRWKGNNPLARARLDTISMFSKLRGKGYLACYIQMDLEDIESVVQLGESVKEVKAVAINDAIKQLNDIPKDRFDPGKAQINVQIVEEVKQLIKRSAND